MKLSSLHSTNTKRVLLFGGPKTGKTLLAGALSQYYNILYFGLEQGHETLFQLPTEWQERIEIVNIPDTRSFPIAIETMLKVIKGGRVEICEDHGKVACMLCKKESAPVVPISLSELTGDTIVVVDSLTQLTNSAIAFITKNQPDEYKLNYDDWAYLGKTMDMFLSHVQQAKYHIICISHETETEMEDGKMKVVPVAGTRAFSRNSAKYFDEVIYAEVKNRKHVFTSTSTASPLIQAGSRSNISMEAQDKPSLLSIFGIPKEVQASTHMEPAQDTLPHTQLVHPVHIPAIQPTQGDKAALLLAAMRAKK